MGSTSSKITIIGENHNQRHRFDETYDLGKEIGVGSFACVNECIRKSDSMQCAVKIMDKRYLSHKEMHGLRDEITILRSVSHPNIIRLMDVFDDKNSVCMVLELCT